MTAAILCGPWKYKAPIILGLIGIAVPPNPTSDDEEVLNNLVRALMSKGCNSFDNFRWELILRVNGKSKEKNLLAKQLTFITDEQFLQLRTILLRRDTTHFL